MTLHDAHQVELNAALADAMERDDVRSARGLAKKGARYYTDAIVSAVKMKSFASLLFYLECGVDPNHYLADETPEKPCPSLLTLAIERARPTMINGKSGIEGTIGQKTQPIIDLLLTYGADVNSPHGTHTPLYAALHNRYVDLALRLVERGADVHEEPYIGTQSVLMEAINLLDRTQPNSQKLFAAILARKPDLDWRAASYNTALQEAIFQGEEAAALCLIEAGADVTLVNYQMHTAATLAASAGMQFVLEAIKEKGVMLAEEIRISSDARYLSDDLLGLAANRGHHELMQWLWDEGVRFHEGVEPAVFEAIGNDHLMAMVWSLAHGASLEQKKGEDTPLRYAVNRHATECFRFLLHLGADIAALGDMTLDELANDEDLFSHRFHDILADHHWNLEQRTETARGQLRQEIAGNRPEPFPETLLDAEGNPTDLLLQMAGGHRLADWFDPSHWQGPNHKPACVTLLAQYREIGRALPPHFHAQWEAIDMAWAEPALPVPQNWTARTAPVLQERKR